jgi:hypothetical protein
MQMKTFLLRHRGKYFQKTSTGKEITLHFSERMSQQSTHRDTGSKNWKNKVFTSLRKKLTVHNL